MTRILGIETAAGACSAAVWTDGNLLMRLEEIERGHAERLAPMLLAVLADAQTAFAELDAVAVSIGPGAFTGLRIGLATARGVALAARLPCFGVTTLAAIADDVAERRAVGLVSSGLPLLVGLDTKRRDFYGQAFGADGAPLGLPIVGDALQLLSLVPGRRALVAGDGVDALAAALELSGGDAQPVHACRTPTASAVARIAARRWLDGERPDTPPSPLYLRAADTGPPLAPPRRS
jgi:universal bacterial protein YeaZ